MASILALQSGVREITFHNFFLLFLHNLLMKDFQFIWEKKIALNPSL